VVKICHFFEKCFVNFLKKIVLQNFYFFEKNRQKRRREISKNSTKFLTIAYSLQDEMCLCFFYFHILNIAKFG